MIGDGLNGDGRRLAYRERRFARMQVSYCLEHSGGFWLSVDSGGESAREYLGSDLESAWLLFCLAVEGEVTPCTLDAVCEDFFYQTRSFGNAR